MLSTETSSSRVIAASVSKAPDFETIRVPLTCSPEVVPDQFRVRFDEEADDEEAIF